MAILVDNQWEIVNILEEIYKIIQNKLSDEIVYKLNEIIEENYSKRIDELEREIEKLEDEIEELRSK